jgi:hypothetical protein
VPSLDDRPGLMYRSSMPVNARVATVGKQKRPAAPPPPSARSRRRRRRGRCRPRRDVWGDPLTGLLGRTRHAAGGCNRCRQHGTRRAQDRWTAASRLLRLRNGRRQRADRDVRWVRGRPAKSCAMSAL